MCIVIEKLTRIQPSHSSAQQKKAYGYNNNTYTPYNNT